MPITKTEAALIAGMDLPTLPDDTQIVRQPGWYQIITPTVKDASVNEVMFSLLQDNTVLDRVESTFATYRQHGLPFKWCIGPMSSPARLEQVLAPRASSTWEFKGMAIDSTQAITAPEDVQVEPVTAQNFAEFLAVNLQGWELKQFAQITESRLMKMISHPDCRGFLARKNGVAIGSGATVVKDGYGYLMGAVILESFRGCGAYKSLIRARLQQLAQDNLAFAVTMARTATSAPVLSRLGFETLYTAKIYRFDT